MDPPRHTEMRALVSRSFTPRRVAEMETPTRELARDLIAGAGPSFDAIEDFAGKLPMAVISTMLGIPRSDQDEVREWSDAMLHRDEGEQDITSVGIEGAMRLHGYLSELVEDRRRQPRDDMTSALVSASDDARALNANEVLGFLFLLVIAGNETTTKLIGNALYWLWRFPDQRAPLLADPAAILEDPTLIPMAVEEYPAGRNEGLSHGSTRRAGPAALHHPRCRTVTASTLPAGPMKGLLLFGSANRDERHWDRADTLDVARNPAAPPRVRPWHPPLPRRRAGTVSIGRRISCTRRQEHHH